MVHEGPQFEFVNRTEELLTLQRCTSPTNDPPCLVFLRAPSGFGKSSLTDKLMLGLSGSDSLVVMVDPDIRARTNAVSVFDGFFIQKCAKAFSEVSTKTNVSFAKVARSNRWLKVADKDPFDLVRNYPGVGSIWSAGIDYAERSFGFGKYSPEKLLVSDSSVAISISRDFVKQATEIKHTILIVRECHHIDHQSLQYFLELQRQSETLTLILEYTVEPNTKAFAQNHEKLIFREIQGHKNACILDLNYLDQHHLEKLLRIYVNPDIELKSEYYAKWDGNLRTLSEIQFRVGFKTQLIGEEEISIDLLNYDRQLNDHLLELGRSELLILAVLAVHEDETSRSFLYKIVKNCGSNSTRDEFSSLIDSLINTHGFIRESGTDLSPHNEDVASAILGARELSGFIALARKSLRDAYLDRLRSGDYLEVSLFACLRRAFRYCAETADASGLLQLITLLSDEVAKSNDQRKFIHTIREATLENSQFLKQDRLKLIEWAAHLAYDIADFYLAKSLLAEVSQTSTQNMVLYANALMETGYHAEAMEVIQKGRRGKSDENDLFALKLSEGILRRATNDRERAKDIFDAISKDNLAQGTAWQGYAFKFMETVVEFDEALKTTLKAASVFSGLNLKTSEAYTRLTAAAHLSRAGSPELALDQIRIANTLTAGTVYDGHILANNKACVLAHQKIIDYSTALAELELARAVAGDDFSQIAVQTNSAAIFSMFGNVERAIMHADKSMRILDDPGFGDKLVHWPVMYNASVIYEKHGKVAEAAKIKDRALTTLPEPMTYGEYWRIRFGLSNDTKKKYTGMTKLPFHFVFLSHWQIDREALVGLS